MLIGEALSAAPAQGHLNRGSETPSGSTIDRSQKMTISTTTTVTIVFIGAGK